VWGYSLRDQRPLLVPEILAYYHAPGGLANRFVQESSNGCASGGSLAEAVYFGLMEVIERDAFLLSWYGRAPLTEIDASATRRPETRAMIDRLAMYGYRARFFDTRISFAVPVVTAVAERVDGGPGRLCFGAGAGLDPEAALAAGLCEIATDAVNLRRRTLREGPRLRAMAADFRRVQVLHDHPLLYGLPEMARYADFLLGRERTERVSPAALARDTITPGHDMRDDVAAVANEVARGGFDVIAIDQTMPEQRQLGFHTAGVIVPGLLPIDFGWSRQRAPGMPRMRTALFEAGLVPAELGPGDLNPAPHPFP
jgi:ribosomal protein S12 methylthiotransferase accessory factor